MVVGLSLRLGAAAAAAQGALASAVLAAPAEVGPGAALVAVIVSAAAGVAAGRRLAGSPATSSAWPATRATSAPGSRASATRARI
jgi:hypothetical protein